MPPVSCSEVIRYAYIFIFTRTFLSTLIIPKAWLIFTQFATRRRVLNALIMALLPNSRCNTSFMTTKSTKLKLLTASLVNIPSRILFIGPYFWYSN
ncbi:hypothetical protein F4779DRAFT_608589 [Xylariaceae sp. FL0662B]|nr:hypothetical protein F4779DRAFT_608589 [Xylariaceae sp. FL0662B]